MSTMTHEKIIAKMKRDHPGTDWTIEQTKQGDVWITGSWTTTTRVCVTAYERSALQVDEIAAETVGRAIERDIDNRSKSMHIWRDRAEALRHDMRYRKV